MGELVSLKAWKKKKADEELKKEIEEINSLKEELSRYLEDMEEPQPMPYIPDEDYESWSKRIVSAMILSLDGYRTWPIDSSDM